jgi:hypothetical protein
VTELFADYIMMVEGHGAPGVEHAYLRARKLMRALPDEQQEEACFRQDLGIACCQQVKLLELQAAMSLERLWQR